MQWILIGIVVVVGVFILMAVMGSSARGMNEDAAQEVKHMSKEEADEILRPSSKTPQEVAQENELYEER